MPKTVINADVNTFEKTSKSNILITKHLIDLVLTSFHAHLFTLFQDILSVFKIALLQI